MQIEKSNLHCVLVKFRRGAGVILVITFVSAMLGLHTSWSSTKGIQYFFSFGSINAANMLSFLDGELSTETSEQIHRIINNKFLVINTLHSIGFSERLSKDMKIKTYFFPSNIDQKSGEWIKRPLSFKRKAIDFIKYSLTGKQDNLKSSDRITRSLVSFMNGKVKISFNKKQRRYEIRMSGVTPKFAEYFLDKILLELNEYFYEKINDKLESDIESIKYAYSLQKSNSSNQGFLMRELDNKKYAMGVISNHPLVLFEKVDKETNLLELKMGTFAYFFVGIFRGLLIGIMLVLFWHRYPISFSNKRSII